MSTKQHEAPGLSHKQLPKLLQPPKGTDSVQPKLTVPETDQQPPATARGMDPLQAQIHQVVFFHTRWLVERHAWADRRQVGLAGKRSARKLFTKEQRAFNTEHVTETPRLEDLTALGPTNVLNLKPVDRESLAGALWPKSGSTPTVRASLNCPQSARQLRTSRSRQRQGGFLAEKGLNLSGSNKPRRAPRSSTSLGSTASDRAGWPARELKWRRHTRSCRRRPPSSLTDQR